MVLRQLREKCLLTLKELFFCNVNVNGRVSHQTRDFHDFTDVRRVSVPTRSGLC